MSYPILDFFKYDHLHEDLKVLSAPFCELAHVLARRETKRPAELATALRKLLEAKDAAVRSALP